jgi:hypothetical protein
MTSVPSENILKLRELTEKMCATIPNDKIIDLVQDIIDEGVEEVVNSKTDKTKIKCYETMCYKITNILTSIKK